MATVGLGRRPGHHARHSRSQHRYPRSGRKAAQQMIVATAERPVTVTDMQKPKVSIENLAFFYGDTKALKDITLPLHDRKVTAFIGPSGCGKSTLLRILNRIYEMYPKQRAEGRVMVDGQNILDARQDINLLRAKIGMVFQKPTPFPMSIYENIAFGVRLYERISKEEMDERVESALRRAALWEEVKNKLHTSGLGQIGRAHV